MVGLDQLKGGPKIFPDGIHGFRSFGVKADRQTILLKMGPNLVETLESRGHLMLPLLEITMWRETST